MNKHKQLLQKVVRQAAISGGVAAACGGIYFFTDSLVDSSVPQKADSERILQRDRTEIGTLTTQLEKSGVAETRFVTIQQHRDTLNFSADNELLKDWLRSAKNQYRLSSTLKLSLTEEKPSMERDVSSERFEVLEHPGMKLEFSAMSDAHVFSFLDEMMRSAPGFFEVQSLSLKRTGDIDTSGIDQMRLGATPYIVEAHVEFNWIGLKEITAKDAAAKNAPGGLPAPSAARPGQP